MTKRKKTMESLRLSTGQLRWICPESLFPFKSTEEYNAEPQIIGQPRAIKAIKTGLEIKHQGYNIFVTGLTGTGRSTTVREILTKLDRKQRPYDDKLYVHNFKEPDMPHLIRLPAGRGMTFKKDMESLVELFKKHLPGIFESDAYKSRLEDITEKYRSQERKLFQELEKTVVQAGFAVVRVQMGTFSHPDLMPLIDGKPTPFDEIDQVEESKKPTPEKIDSLKTQYLELKKELDKVLMASRDLERKLQQEVEKVVKEFGMPCVDALIDDVRRTYNTPSVKKYLDEIRDYTLAEITIFLKKEERPSQESASSGISSISEPFRLYRVNLLVDNSEQKSVPVIIETAPNYKNLFGTIEKVVDRSGNWVSDFMNIKAGSFLRADGGFLVINLLEAISETWVWQTLKRSLKYGQLEIESPESFYLFGHSALKPEPIKINLKVVLIGDKAHYLLLYHYDEDFKKIFKISADFDDRMDRTDKHIIDYVSFITNFTNNENIAPLSPSGVAAVLEESVRLTERQDKLSAKFSDIADLIRESAYHAKNSSLIERDHVQRAIKERTYLRGMFEEQIQEYIDQGTIMIETSGFKAGQINGLAVYDFGESSFGKPAKITCSISTGRSGIINIEREAELSGRIHDKGVQILTGFLRGRFAQNKPLAFTASICFEQSYGGIDGDSASSTELYLLMATLAGVKINQGIAVTGSVNQHGMIQPIGGVNQKIEGFFDVCKKTRLTGKQGVIIPIQNVSDLQLRIDIVDAVGKGRFNIWAVETIDQGLELLTGISAGNQSPDGSFEKDSLNDLIDRRLFQLAANVRDFEASIEKRAIGQKIHRKKGPPAPPPPPRQPTRRRPEDETDSEKSRVR